LRTCALSGSSAEVFSGGEDAVNSGVLYPASGEMGTRFALDRAIFGKDRRQFD
jgi:hypothetical protein